ncbi:MAG: CoA-binding protein [Paludibacter sp.]|nr:CoA-binding protein [Paludibacter sp.]MDD4198353.1 CoA-binding protein [Paludibacter sp.]MDD4428329.1 CoA-binding protein [Paludibacter sp.]
MKKKTLIIGANSNPERYAYKAAQKLLAHGHQIELLGLRSDVIFNQTIDTERKDYQDIDTVTLYIGPKNQPSYYDYVVSLNPRRVVFNPGTENPEFEILLKKNGIAYEQACTLVLLGTNQY